MISKTKLALIVGVLAVSLAAPAYAQSFDRDFGTGNVRSFSYGSDAGGLCRTTFGC